MRGDFSRLTFDENAAGDSVCGTEANKCDTFSELGKVIKGVLGLVMKIFSAVAVLLIIVYFIFAWFKRKEGDVRAYAEARNRLVNIIFTFGILALLAGGVYITFLQSIGVNSGLLQTLKEIFGSVSFIETAYADFPDTVTSATWYDFLLLFMTYAIKWVFYPIIIVIWIWTGFIYVAAQGAPEKLKEAHKILAYSLITTVAVIMAQSFFFAIKETVNKIIGG